MDISNINGKQWQHITLPNFTCRSVMTASVKDEITKCLFKIWNKINYIARSRKQPLALRSNKQFPSSNLKYESTANTVFLNDNKLTLIYQTRLKKENIHYTYTCRIRNIRTVHNPAKCRKLSIKQAWVNIKTITAVVRTIWIVSMVKRTCISDIFVHMNVPM